MVENKSRTLSPAQRVALPENTCTNYTRGKNVVERFVDASYCDQSWSIAGTKDRINRRMGLPRKARPLEDVS